MVFDFTSLLVAAGLSGFCLAATMFTFWLSASHERFMVTWAAGLLVITLHVLIYWVYTIFPEPMIATLVIVMLPVGLTFVYVASIQFTHSGPAIRHIALVFAAFLAIVLPLMASGYDGTALIVHNGAAAGLLFVTGLTYWRHRSETPVFITVMTALYMIMGVTFALCGLHILWTGQWQIGHAPDNWAERLNIVAAVACLPAVGALSLALNQSRIATKHHNESLTDPLTGLLNRRALFRFHDRPFGRYKAILLFDLDHFKAVNDAHGHATGDEVIRRFAAALAKHSRPRDEAIRLGGEEFALVMDRASPEQVRAVAGRIAKAFSQDTVMTPEGPLRTTVSAGIGFGDIQGASLEEVLDRADRALYSAKQAGRDRIEGGPWLMTG